MRKIDITKWTLTGLVVLVVIMGSITVITMENRNTLDMRPPTVIELENEVKENIYRLAYEKGEMEEDDLSKLIEDEIPAIISSYSLQKVADIRATQVEVGIERTSLLVDLPDAPPVVEDPYGQQMVNHLLTGTSGYGLVRPGLLIGVDMTLEIEDGETDTYRSSFEMEVVDRALLLDSIMSMIGDDMEGWGSGLARDLEYMLNTLTRSRILSGVGQGNRDTPRQILNEGDVELALNIALAIRIARYTGQMPDNLVSNIDNFFSDQTVKTTMNPTGFRIWGETERSNFIDFTERKGHSNERSMDRLMRSILDSGSCDPADLLSSYLYADRMFPGGKFLFDPTDGRSPLESMNLINPRQSQDRTDAFSLRTNINFPEGEGIGVKSYLDLDEGATENKVELDIDLEGGYLVSGKEYTIDGIYEHSAWMTNVDLTKTIEDLTSKVVGNNTRGGSPETRCGIILPPSRPDDHDHRISWDLYINGSLSLHGSCSGWGGNSISVEEISRKIDMSIPVRVFSWFDEVPVNLDAFDFVNLNRYGQTGATSGTSSVILISAESNATEFFESKAYQPLRGAFSILTSLNRGLSNLESGSQDEVSFRRNAIVMSQTAKNRLSAWTELPGRTIGLKEMMEKYVEGKILLSDLGNIRSDGLEYELSYMYSSDRMVITGHLPEGETRLIITGVTAPPSTFDAVVKTGGGTTVTMDPEGNRFLLSGNTGSGPFNDGSGVLGEPRSEVIDLVLGTSWVINGPTVSAEGFEVPRPFGLGAEKEDGLLIALQLTGDSSTDDGELLEAITSSDDRSGDLLSQAGIASGAVDGRDDAIWMGFNIRYRGEPELASLSRSVFFRSEDGYGATLEGYFLRDLITTSLLPGVPGFNDVGGFSDVVIIERTSFSSLPLDGGTPSSDCYLVTHINRDNGRQTVRNHAFFEEGSGSDPYSFDLEDWSRTRATAPSPLW